METTREPGKVKNESGMTLVELLAALALVSLVVILINTVFFFTQRNADSLSTESDVQENLLLAMKVVTKDVRSADKAEADENFNLYLNDKKPYALQNQVLYKNGNPVAEDIVSFNACHPLLNSENEKLTCEKLDNNKPLDKDRIIIILQGPDNRAGNHRTLATEINLIR